MKTSCAHLNVESSFSVTKVSTVVFRPNAWSWSHCWWKHSLFWYWTYNHNCSLNKCVAAPLDLPHDHTWSARERLILDQLASGRQEFCLEWRDPVEKLASACSCTLRQAVGCGNQHFHAALDLLLCCLWIPMKSWRTVGEGKCEEGRSLGATKTWFV